MTGEETASEARRSGAQLGEGVEDGGHGRGSHCGRGAESGKCSVQRVEWRVSAGCIILMSRDERWTHHHPQARHGEVWEARPVSHKPAMESQTPGKGKQRSWRRRPQYRIYHKGHRYRQGDLEVPPGGDV